MSQANKDKLKKLIAETVGGEYKGKSIPDDLRLVGNVLDSMAVTKLITAIEENFGFAFDDEDLSAESFETVASLFALVESKTSG